MSLKRLPFPRAAGCLDHIAFFGADPASFVARLKARGLKYDLRRLPESGHAAGTWQLFFFDPSGARVEIDFAATESVERRPEATRPSTPNCPMLTAPRLRRL